MVYSFKSFGDWSAESPGNSPTITPVDRRYSDIIGNSPVVVQAARRYPERDIHPPKRLDM